MSFLGGISKISKIGNRVSKKLEDTDLAQREISRLIVSGSNSDPCDTNSKGFELESMYSLDGVVITIIPYEVIDSSEVNSEGSLSFPSGFLCANIVVWFSCRRREW